MSKTYRHLSRSERWQIYALHTSGKSARSIADQLGRSPSTIAAELKRGYRAKGGGYCPVWANRVYLSSRERSGETRRLLDGALWQEVRKGLLRYWSPEQIAGRLALEGKASVSHMTIYRKLWRERDPAIMACLRHRGKRYKPAGINKYSPIPGRVDITQRPVIVEGKSRIGDWEADTIIGKQHQGAILSLVERASKYTKLSLLEAKQKNAVTVAAINSLKQHKHKVLTITYDNGTEFCGHQQINQQLKCQSYFATPHHAWERGLNEHTNGLVRQFLPKATNFKQCSKKEIKQIENLLNNRPRKVLNYQTPNEVFRQTQLSSLIR